MTDLSTKTVEELREWAYRYQEAATDESWRWPYAFDELARRLANARNEAFEQAAQICEQRGEDNEGPDCWGWHQKDYARAIRALKDQKP